MSGVDYPPVQPLRPPAASRPYKWALHGRFASGRAEFRSQRNDLRNSQRSRFLHCRPSLRPTPPSNKATSSLAVTIRPVSADLILSTGFYPPFSVYQRSGYGPGGGRVSPFQSTAVATQNWAIRSRSARPYPGSR